MGLTYSTNILNLFLALDTSSTEVRDIWTGFSARGDFLVVKGTLILRSWLRLMLLMSFPFAPHSAKVHVLFSDPLLQTGGVSVCGMFSSVSGFAYVQLLPLAVERDGQIAQWESSFVMLSSPLFSPSSFFSACVSQAVIAEWCWRLRAACRKFCHFNFCPFLSLYIT